jgi:hypothetical protein
METETDDWHRALKKANLKSRKYRAALRKIADAPLDADAVTLTSIARAVVGNRKRIAHD